MTDQANILEQNYHGSRVETVINAVRASRAEGGAPLDVLGLPGSERWSFNMLCNLMATNRKSYAHITDDEADSAGICALRDKGVIEILAVQGQPHVVLSEKALGLLEGHLGLAPSAEPAPKPVDRQSFVQTILRGFGQEKPDADR